MPRALITGSIEHTARVVEAFDGRGVASRVAHEPAGVPEAVEGETFDYYVQLPWPIEVEGETVVARVRHFLASGLLARFMVVEQVLDRLTEPATVVLVAGHVPGPMTGPDDRTARLALLNVLAHAARTDRGAQGLRVQVTSIARPADELVRIALGENPDQERLVAALETGGWGSSYADWRTEILGLATVEV